MNISPVSLNSMNFGQVTRSAVQKAIKSADGNIQNLETIRDCMVEQISNNRYDVHGMLSGVEDFNYMVQKKEHPFHISL